MAFSILFADPEIAVTAVASMLAVVLFSIVNKSRALTDPASIVTPILARWLIPFELIALAISAAVPVIEVTAVALTTADVFLSIVIKSLATTDPADTLTPTFAIWLMPLELRAVAMSAAKPVSVLTAVAIT